MNTSFQAGHYGHFSNILTAQSRRLDLSETIEQARVLGFSIPKNPEVIVNKTLKAHGLVRFSTSIPEPAGFINTILTGSNNKLPIFSYGAFAFVVLPDGSIGFAKLRYGSKNIQKVISDGELIDAHVGGLRREAKVLKELGKLGFHVPKVFEYHPAILSPMERNSAQILEVLVIEAIIPPHGSIIPAKKWTPALSRLMANKLKTFTSSAQNIPLFRSEGIAIPLDILIQISRLSGNGDFDQTLKRIIHQYKYFDNPVIVHGDTWPDNIGIKHESDLLFLDWELAGLGYKGQDAGRTLWGLTFGRTKGWNLTNMNKNSLAFIDEWCKSADDRNILRFGVIFESLRWIAERQDKLNADSLTSQSRHHLQDEISDIKLHALQILDYI